jgi:hypothetical protein
MVSVGGGLGEQDTVNDIFTKNDIEEIINLQPIGSKGKPYQIKQVRNIILRYKITLENNNEP